MIVHHRRESLRGAQEVSEIILLPVLSQDCLNLLHLGMVRKLESGCSAGVAITAPVSVE